MLVCRLLLRSHFHSRPVFKLVHFVRPFCIKGTSLALIPGVFRRITCKKHPLGDISRRAEYLTDKLVQKSPPILQWADLWSIVRPYFGWLLASIACAVFVALLNIRLPILLGDLVNIMTGLVGNDNVGKRDISSLRPIAFNLLAHYGAQALLTFGYISLLSILGERMASDLRLLLFTKLIHQDMSFYDWQRTGELSWRLNSDVQEFKSCFKVCISQGLRTIAQVGGSVVSLYLISPQMTLSTIAVLPILIGIGAFFTSYLRDLSRNAQCQNALAQGIADETFGNIRTVRSFAMEDAEARLYKNETHKAAKMNEYLGVGIGLFQGATNFLLNGLVLFVLYGGSKLIISTEMTAGDLMSFLVTAQTIQKSLGQFSIVFGNFLKGCTAAAGIFQLINMDQSMRIFGGEILPDHSLIGNISFKNVKFRYPTRPNHLIFDNLNLTIQAGTVVALCGISGSGKSTIAALLERFYEHESGTITIDNMDIRSLDPQWLRGRAIGLISQEPVLFATTVAENIRYGRPDATDQQVLEVAKQANADEFISNFPLGYDTVVGERGVTLSGGQKQRIAIARALLKNPPILILDEATSALDMESEKLVRDALEKAVRGRTVIVIAHRLSTVQNSDLIAVVKGKKIAEIGSHKELLKKKGLYWDLVQSQYDN